ncbi:MAG: chromosome partitioning protein ParB, partial [Acetivibrio ethanolgignens]
KLEAMKRQGKRTDLTSAQLGRKLSGKESREILAEQVGESRNQISRYIRLTELIPDILEMVDEKKISFNAGVEMSHLRKEEQQQLMEAMEYDECVPSLNQAQRLKKASAENRLTKEVIAEILSEERAGDMKLTIGGGKIKKYFPQEYTPKQMEQVILELLEHWSKDKQR